MDLSAITPANLDDWISVGISLLFFLGLIIQWGAPSVIRTTQDRYVYGLLLVLNLVFADVDSPGWDMICSTLVIVFICREFFKTSES